MKWVRFNDIDWSLLGEAYGKFAWSYAHIFLRVMKWFLIVYLALALLALCYILYRIVILDDGRYPLIALPMMGLALLVVAGALRLTVWGIAKTRGGAASPLAVQVRAIRNLPPFRIFIAWGAGAFAAQFATVVAMGVHRWLYDTIPDPNFVATLMFVGLTLALSSFVVVGATFLFGVPIHFLLRRFNCLSLGCYISAGIVASCVGVGGLLAMHVSGSGDESLGVSICRQSQFWCCLPVPWRRLSSG